MISLLQLETSASDCPIFMVHWIERDLARHLGARRPVYGLSFGASADCDCERSPPQDIEAVASHYIDEMRSIQPKGPYQLVGHSSGGMIAYEMAQQLSKAGDAVSFLGLIGANTVESMQSRAFLPKWQIAVNIVKAAPTVGWRKLNDKIKSRLFKKSGAIKARLNKIIDAPYNQQPYRGRVHLFVETEPFKPIRRQPPPSPATGWQKFALGGLVRGLLRCPRVVHI